ncbi:MAG: peptidase S41 [Magnetovibrio sp.]|nr:peptidase S41 [Magnetovibrio sp.]
MIRFIYTRWLLTFLLIFPANKITLAAENQQINADTYKLLNLFGEVFERVRSDYVEKPKDEEIIEAAISGMLMALDPHSSYLNKKNFQEMRVNTKGQFGGLGIQVTMEGGVIKVISPIDDTPAHRAGVEAGDIITHLDGESVQGMTLSLAVEKMRGKAGSDIKLTIFRTGEEPFDLTITRAVIKLTSVRTRAEENVGYIRITSFTEQTHEGLKKGISSLKKKIGPKIEGYVLDLRNNPGGLLDQAINVSDSFLERGEIVSTRARSPEDTERHAARPGDLTDGLPLVILINGGSASASEIVAGALQDHNRAILLGTQSFGKGSVQTIMPLPGHGAMRLTTARYYTPSGRSIQAKGITPDIIVSPASIQNVEKTRDRREKDLRGALDKVTEEKAGPAVLEDTKKRPQKKHKSVTPNDYQLLRALDLIRGLSLYSKMTTAISK